MTPADAVVVLGAEVLGSDRPSVAVRRRLTHGVEALAKWDCHTLVVAGGVGRGGVSEASVMRLLALGMGVPAESVVMEETSRNTLEQAACVASLARERGWRLLVLVSDRFHLPRALFLFRKMGIDVEGDPTAGRGEASLRQWWAGYFREAGAWVRVAWRAASGKQRRLASGAAGPTRRTPPPTGDGGRAAD